MDEEFHRRLMERMRLGQVRILIDKTKAWQAAKILYGPRRAAHLFWLSVYRIAYVACVAGLFFIPWPYVAAAICFNLFIVRSAVLKSAIGFSVEQAKECPETFGHYLICGIIVVRDVDEAKST